ncbi:PEP/pyruvate-binding domain-containing protein [Pedobacter nyackensis]|uniref:PEP/pyruvate-binding domain-containing protein n=1 Tax=Pedobacter nyackensis TaxID=475255 RepID=UPI002931638D|nr:PEP/pyruvate-binding domain-containing protein [Pedobacter nyackensis]
MDYIKRLNEMGINDINEVGAKNASLGEMFKQLNPEGMVIPRGFAVTASAYRHFLHFNELTWPLSQLMKELNRSDYNNLSEIGKQARTLIMSGRLTNAIGMAIISTYESVFEHRNQLVVVRSSAIAEDYPEIDFAGLHESYLNVKGNYALLYSIKQCYASLYSDRAIRYREDKGYGHNKIFLSAGVQEMIPADIDNSFEFTE